MKKLVYGMMATGVITVFTLGVNYSNPDIYGVESTQQEKINYSNPDIYGLGSIQNELINYSNPDIYG